MLFFHYCTSGLSSTNISQSASFAAFNLIDQKKRERGRNQITPAMGTAFKGKLLSETWPRPKITTGLGNYEK